MLELFEDEERVFAVLYVPPDKEQSDFSARTSSARRRQERALVRGSDERRTNKAPTR